MTPTAVNPIINKPRETPTRRWARSSSQNIVGADRPEPGRLPTHGRLPHGHRSQPEEPTPQFSLRETVSGQLLGVMHLQTGEQTTDQTERLFEHP